MTDQPPWGVDLAATKQRLRRWARDLPPATPAESTAVVDRVDRLPELEQAGRVCVYLAMPGEVNLDALGPRRSAVDWVTTRTGDEPLLTVHALDAPRERHRYGFEQPVADSPVVDAATVDLWLVPGLAFDPAGNRLGNGAGYYDRLLATAAPTATFVGITLDRRVRAELPHQPHDRRMHVVVTESRTIRP